MYIPKKIEESVFMKKKPQIYNICRGLNILIVKFIRLDIYKLSDNDQIASDPYANNNHQKQIKL